MKTVKTIAKINCPDNTMTLTNAVKIAILECKDVNAQAYLNSIPESIEFGGSIGEAEHAFKVQLLYAYSNMTYWRGENAREAKKAIKEYIKDLM